MGASRQIPERLHVPTRDDVMRVATAYAMKSNLSLARLSAYALGDASLLPRAAKDPRKRIYLDTAAQLLNYIETNPAGTRG